MADNNNFQKNFTGIYKVRYESGDWVGEASFRYRYVFAPAPADGFVAAVGAVFEAMGGMFYDNFAYLGAKNIPANQSRSFDWVTPTNQAAVRAEALDVTPSPECSSMQVGFVGKNGASTATVYFGGVSAPIVMANSGPKPWRTTVAEWGRVGTVVAALNAAGIAAPNNQHATFLPYMNFQFNKEYVRKNRG